MVKKLGNNWFKLKCAFLNDATNMTCQNFQSHNNFPLNIIHWLHDVNWELLPNIAFSFFSLVSKIKNNKLRLEENFEKSQNFYCTNRKRIVNIKNVLFLVNIKNLLRICKFIQ